MHQFHSRFSTKNFVKTTFSTAIRKCYSKLISRNSYTFRILVWNILIWFHERKKISSIHILYIFVSEDFKDFRIVYKPLHNFLEMDEKYFFSKHLLIMVLLQWPKFKQAFSKAEDNRKEVQMLKIILQNCLVLKKRTVYILGTVSTEKKTREKFSSSLTS